MGEKKISIESTIIVTQIIYDDGTSVTSINLDDIGFNPNLNHSETIQEPNKFLRAKGILLRASNMANEKYEEIIKNGTN